VSNSRTFHASQHVFYQGTQRVQGDLGTPICPAGKVASKVIVMASQVQTRAKSWLTGRAIRLHITLAIVAPGCLALGWWQLHCALGGNMLSWVYTFEWPGFAVYGVYTWHKLLKDLKEQQAEEEAAALAASESESSAVEEHATSQEDEEIASYNQYLAALHEADEAPYKALQA